MHGGGFAFGLHCFRVQFFWLPDLPINPTREGDQYKPEAQASGFAVWNHSLALRARIFNPGEAIDQLAWIVWFVECRALT